MEFIKKMQARARNFQGSLVLPEGSEPRTIAAARRIIDEQLAASVVLTGDPAKIANAADETGIDLEGISVVDPAASENRDRFAEEFLLLRKHKGITIAEAQAEILNPLNFAAMMVRLGLVDAMVAGAENSTGNVLRAAFTIIKTAPGVTSASSCFVMDTHSPQFGSNGLMIFADCATIPEPNTEQLAEIAVAAAQSCRDFLEVEPCVAMLSFSTKGSAKHPEVDKVREACKMVQAAHPDITIDGELQADAAIIPAVAQKKAPQTAVGGKANVLVFPNLAAGNISYKLVQRIAGADAYGPFLQGFAKPVSDLSRGCSIDDIVNTSAVTLAQASAQPR